MIWLSYMSSPITGYFSLLHYSSTMPSYFSPLKNAILPLFHVFTQIASFIWNVFPTTTTGQNAIYSVTLNFDNPTSMKPPQASLGKVSIFSHKLLLSALQMIFGIAVIILYYNYLFPYLFL